MNTRLKQFLAAENISQSQFADTIKVVRASVSHVLSGRNKPGYDFICAIMSAYPSLNIEWLIAGKGKMYKNSPITESNPAYSADTLTPYYEAENAPTLFSTENDVEDLLQETTQTIAALPVRTNTIDQSHNTITSIDSTDNKPQAPVKQRKAIKVTIFYDDGTFQEM